MKQKCKIVELSFDNVYENMKKDLRLLQMAIETDGLPILRIYGWEPAGVTLGRNQTAGSINQKHCQTHNIDIATRPTGGRAVFHQGDLSYCFIIKASQLEHGASVRGAYKEISSALLLALRNIGVEGACISESKRAYTKSSACMAISTGADLEYNGKKLAGSAQLRKNGFILQHGSILLQQDFDQAACILGVQPSEMNCINLRELISPIPPVTVFAQQIQNSFASIFNLTFEPFAPFEY